MTGLFGAGDARRARLSGFVAGAALSLAASSGAWAVGLAGAAAGGGLRASLDALAAGDFSVLGQPAVAGGIAAAALALVLLVTLALRGGGKKKAPAAKAAPARATPVQRSVQPAPARPASTRPAAVATPAAKPASSQAHAPRTTAIVLPTRPSRKLDVEIMLKPRDGAWPLETAGGPIKLVRERVGVIAHTDKRKLIPDPDSAKRRPSPIPSGRRSASFRSPSP